jgi:hypothetical protein
MRLTPLPQERLLFTRSNRCVNCGFLGLSKSDVVPIPKHLLSPDGLSASEYLQVTEFRHAIDEVIPLTRSNIGPTHPDLRIFRCARNIWHPCFCDDDDPTSKELVAQLTHKRKCKYFFRYSPGLDPKQHLQLEQQHRTNVMLFWATIVGAVVGAVLAIIAGHFT